MSRACDIECRSHSGEHISDEELAFCNSIMPSVNMEKFYLQWRNHLLFAVIDGMLVLNYLYYLDITNMLYQTTIEQMLEILRAFSPDDYKRLHTRNTNQRQRLAQHKAHIIQKISEFGKYDDLDISDTKEADIREHI